MKNISFIFILLAFLTSNLVAQTYSITDDLIYEADCDPSNTVIATDPFNFEIEFDSYMQNSNLQHQFSRTVEAVFTDAAGNILKTVNLGWNRIVDATYDIYETHFDGLPDGEIHVDIVVTYKHTINNPYTNPLTVKENGTNVASITFTNTSQELVVTFEDVLCFTFNNCDDLDVGLYIKLGYMRSSVNPGGSNVSYQWYIDPNNGPGYYAGTNDRVALISGCATYYLTVTDLDTGCKYRASKSGCNVDVIGDPQCLIGIPSGLAWTGVDIFGGYILDWNDTPGAGSYTVIITLNDEACCNSPWGETVLTYNNLSQSTFTFYPKSSTTTPCFSWSVIAHCPEGTSGSSTSESVCLFGLQAEEELDTRNRISSELIVYPNPATDVVNISLHAISSDQAQVTILDAQGKVIHDISISTTSNSLNYSWMIPSNMNAGVYYVQIKDQEQLYTKKFIYLK